MEQEGQQQAEDVTLAPICATAWVENDLRRIDRLETPAGQEVLRDAHRRGGPVWLELGFPDLSETPRAYFEGSLDVWMALPTPRIDWSRVSPVLDCLELRAPESEFRHNEPSEATLLRVLPHVWARGIFRALKDLSPARQMPKDALLFPTVGFQPEGAVDEVTEVPGFITIRINVGVIGGCVITTRLPDFLCAGNVTATRPQAGSGVKMLTVPQRFLPFKRPEAQDLAEAIAHHQAATARAVTEPLRAQLRDLEHRSMHDENQGARNATAETRREKLSKRIAPPSTRDQRLKTSEAVATVVEMNEIVYGLDRQVSRLLRRFGSFAGGPSMSEPRLIPSEAYLRYQFALDELRSLRDDCRLARELISAKGQADDRDERERFQFVAALLASAILVPTLIAGIYGANVGLPGPKKEGFGPLMLFVAGFGLLGLFAVNEIWIRRWLPRTGWSQRQGPRVLTGVLALAALAVGLFLLAQGSG